jgi:hypothetical protein
MKVPIRERYINGYNGSPAVTYIQLVSTVDDVKLSVISLSRCSPVPPPS